MEWVGRQLTQASPFNFEQGGKPAESIRRPIKRPDGWIKTLVRKSLIRQHHGGYGGTCNLVRRLPGADHGCLEGRALRVSDLPRSASDGPKNTSSTLPARDAVRRGAKEDASCWATHS